MTLTEKEKKIEWIQNSLDHKISSFSRKAKFNRRMASFQHGITAFLGSVITIIAGLDLVELRPYLRITILIISSLITLIGAFKSFFNNNLYWLDYIDVVNQLKSIKSDFEYYLTGREISKIELEVLKNYTLKIQNILENANKSWKKSRITNIYS